MQGCCGVLFCPSFLIRTLKSQNVLFSPFKDTQLSFFSKFTLIFTKLDHFERNFVIICLQNLVGAFMNDFCVGF